MCAWLVHVVDSFSFHSLAVTPGGAVQVCDFFDYATEFILFPFHLDCALKGFVIGNPLCAVVLVGYKFVAVAPDVINLGSSFPSVVCL